MGVRLYNNARGLFTGMDPVEGGSSSAYAYPFDPINQFDLNGKWWGSDLASAAWKNRGRIIQYAGYAAVGVCVIATAGACAVAAGVVAGISVINRGGSFIRRKQYRSASGWGRFIGGSAIDIISARLPGVRFSRGTYLSRHAISGRHVLRQAYIPLRRVFSTRRGWRNFAGFGAGAAWARWGW